MEVHGVSLQRYVPDQRQAAPDPRFFTEVAGLMNVSACVAAGPGGHARDAVGPDILMSLPHFCYVDSAIAAQARAALTPRTQPAPVV